jgi:Fungal specific transcription factor domain
MVLLASLLTFLKWERVPSEPPSPQYFPADDLLTHLIQLYFDNINIHLPLLHRPTLERSISDKLHLNNCLFGASVLAICAVASRFSSDPRVVLEGTDSLHSSGWKWFQQIKLFQRPMSQDPSVFELQTYLVCLNTVFTYKRGHTFSPAISIIFAGNFHSRSLLDFDWHWCALGAGGRRSSSQT